MKALSIEQTILEGEYELKELFKYVIDHAEEFKAYDMEKAIFSRLMQIGQVAIRSYFAQKGTGDVGKELELEGVVLKRSGGLCECDYFSVFGKVRVPRTCYRTEGVSGIMPLDAQADLPERTYSYLLQEWMDMLSIRETFKESEVTLSKLLGLEVCASRFEVVSRDSSVNYDKFYEKKDLPDTETEGEIQVAQFDGKGVPMIKRELTELTGRLGKGEKRQKKKEAMVGVSYTVDRKERTAEEIAENLIYPEKARERKEELKKKGIPVKDVPKAKNIRRMASIEKSKQAVVEEIVGDAMIRNKDNKRPLVIIMDGALSLWALILKVLCGIDFIGILDIIHVSEYLWNVGNSLYGENTEEGKKWVYRQLLSILQGEAGRVIGGMKQMLKKRKLKASQRKAIEAAIKYFENHKKWMKYDQYLKAGYPIGTGVVESTCGQVKQRMEGCGRRWSVNGAESVLLLRSIYTSGDWDSYWQSHMRLEHERIYGNVMNAINIIDEVPVPSDDYNENKKTKKAV